MSNKKETFILPNNPMLANKLNRLSKAIEDAEKPFIVNLTLDPEYSGSGSLNGSMDKTVSELLAAHNSGKRILFKLSVAGIGTEIFSCTEVAFMEGDIYPSFNSAFITQNPFVQNTTSLIWFFTGITSTPTDNTWYTYIYPLTNLIN